jgi:hypothetical protein
LSPAGGEVGVGYFIHCGEGHFVIIRLGAHIDWIRGRVWAMQASLLMAGRQVLRRKVRV